MQYEQTILKSIRVIHYFYEFVPYEKEASISSKYLFKDNSDFIKKSLKKSNNRVRPPQKMA